MNCGDKSHLPVQVLLPFACVWLQPNQYTWFVNHFESFFCVFYRVLKFCRHFWCPFLFLVGFCIHASSCTSSSLACDLEERKAKCINFSLLVASGNPVVIFGSFFLTPYNILLVTKNAMPSFSKSLCKVLFPLHPQPYHDYHSLLAGLHPTGAL